MKKTIQLGIGLAIGGFLLWLLFRDTNWGEVYDALKGISKGWFAVAVLLLLVSFVTRVQRWTYIVRTAKWVSFRHMFSATQIGFLANFTLPGRVGEVVRAAVLARLAGLPFSKCFAMVALDRVTDLIGLVVVIAVAACAYSPEGAVVIPKETFGTEMVFSAEWVKPGEIGAILSLVFFVAALVALYLKQGLALRISDRCLNLVSARFARWVHTFLQHFAEGLHIFRSAADMAKSIFFSLLTWGCFLLIIVALLKAFHIECPWYTVFVMELLVAVFISVPGAPGFVGQFHFPIVVTLMMLVPDMNVSTAKAFAILAHLINVIPVAAVGVFCMLWENFGLTELGQAAGDAPPEKATGE